MKRNFIYFLLVSLFFTVNAQSCNLSIPGPPVTGALAKCNFNYANSAFLNSQSAFISGNETIKVSSGYCSTSKNKNFVYDVKFKLNPTAGTYIGNFGISSTNCTKQYPVAIGNSVGVTFISDFSSCSSSTEGLKDAYFNIAGLGNVLRWTIRVGN